MGNDVSHETPTSIEFVKKPPAVRIPRRSFLKLLGGVVVAPELPIPLAHELAQQEKLEAQRKKYEQAAQNANQVSQSVNNEPINQIFEPPLTDPMAQALLSPATIESMVLSQTVTRLKALPKNASDSQVNLAISAATEPLTPGRQQLRKLLPFAHKLLYEHPQEIADLWTNDQHPFTEYSEIKDQILKQHIQAIEAALPIPGFIIEKNNRAVGSEADLGKFPVIFMDATQLRAMSQELRSKHPELPEDEIFSRLVEFATLHEVVHLLDIHSNRWLNKSLKKDSNLASIYQSRLKSVDLQRVITLPQGDANDRIVSDLITNQPVTSAELVDHSYIYAYTRMRQLCLEHNLDLKMVFDTEHKIRNATVQDQQKYAFILWLCSSEALADLGATYLFSKLHPSSDPNPQVTNSNPAAEYINQIIGALEPQNRLALIEQCTQSVCKANNAQDLSQKITQQIAAALV